MNMATLVVGASGATGRLLVTELLKRDQQVKIVVRSRANLPKNIKAHKNLTIIEASILDLSSVEIANLVKGCTAVASCLGHNMTFKGIFGHPRRLVTDATRRLCDAVRANGPQHHVKFVLMNTTGNQNRNIDEPISFAQKCVIAIFRVLLPPHVDNENAADYLRNQNEPMIQWVAVRPDGLVDEQSARQYSVHKSPTQSAIFDAGKTSRINVAHFMAQLIHNDDTWQKWQGKMPVIYNQD